MAALTFSVGMPNLIMKRILSLFSFPPLVFSGRPFQPLVMMPSRDPWRELLRILLPRTRVNKGKKPRGRDPVEPRPVTQIVDALLVTHLHCRRTSMRRHYLSKPTWRPRCSDASFPPDARRRASIRTLVGPAMRTGCMMGFVLWGPALLSR